MAPCRLARFEQAGLLDNLADQLSSEPPTKDMARWPNVPWLRDETFPPAPTPHSHGVMCDVGEKSLALEVIKRKIKRNALGLSALVWSPSSAYALPPWDHPSLVDAAWRSSKRFWIGLSVIALCLIMPNAFVLNETHWVSDQPGALSAIVANAIDLLTSVLLLLFCSWQLHRTFIRSSGYLLEASEWRRFNAWARRRGGVWPEVIVAALVGVFVCEAVFESRMADSQHLELLRRFAISLDWILKDHQLWRILTATVLHAGPPHIFAIAIAILFCGRWVLGIAPRSVFLLVLGFGAWFGSVFGLFDAVAKPAIGLSAGTSALESFLIAAWLRTRLLPPYLGPFLIFTDVTGVISDLLSRDHVVASAHIGGYLIGFVIGFALIEPRTSLPIRTGRLVDAAGYLCGMALLTTCVFVSLRLVGLAG